MKQKRKGNLWPKRVFGMVLVLLVAAVGTKLWLGRDAGPLGETPSPRVFAPASSYIDAFFTTPGGETLEYVQKVRIASAGDIMTHSTQITAAYDSSKGTYDFTDNFVHVKKYFESAHMAVANFETVTAGGTPQGYPIFNAPDSILDAVKGAGIKLLGTANNHSLDKGKAGLVRTIQQIQARDLLSTGSFLEPETQITTMEENGVRLGFLAYTYGLNGLEGYLSEGERSYMINVIREDKIKEDIEKAREQGCDGVVVIIHWGNEYQRTPSAQQTALAQKLFTWGADVVLGSHPHVIQKSEMVEVNGQQKYIIYSQGNFLSNQRRETLPDISVRNYTEDGVIVHVGLEKDPIRNTLSVSSVSYTPTWVYRYASGGKQNYEILPVGETLATGNATGEVRTKLQGSYENTMGMMTLYNGGRYE